MWNFLLNKANFRKMVSSWLNKSLSRLKLYLSDLSKSIGWLLQDHNIKGLVESLLWFLSGIINIQDWVWEVRIPFALSKLWSNSTWLERGQLNRAWERSSRRLDSWPRKLKIAQQRLQLSQLKRRLPHKYKISAAKVSSSMWTQSNSVASQEMTLSCDGTGCFAGYTEGWADHTCSTKQMRLDRGTKPSKVQREHWLRDWTTPTYASFITHTTTTSVLWAMNSFQRTNLTLIPSSRRKWTRREVNYTLWLESHPKISQGFMFSSGVRFKRMFLLTGLSTTTFGREVRECRPERARRTTIREPRRSTALWLLRKSRIDNKIVHFDIFEGDGVEIEWYQKV